MSIQKNAAREVLAAIALTFALSSHASEQAPAVDQLFSQPIVDVDEWRDAPVRHRYVHGCFKGTQTCFSFYYPPKKQYEGRFFQHITPVPISENLAQKEPLGEHNKIGFSIDSGAYFVETNGGGELDRRPNADSSIVAYRANAAAAQYSRVIAQKMYGGKRPYGYAYGGSGGGYRTIGGLENTQGVWDGAVPYVIGSSMAIPNVFTVRLRAMSVLKHKLPQIADAMEPGGSGNPYHGLNDAEAAALREVTRMGFPLPAWFGYKKMDLHGLASLYPGVAAADRAYFTDFWNKPGYLGFDQPEQLADARVQFKGNVAELITAGQVASEAHQGGGVDTAFRRMEVGDAQRIVAIRLTGLAVQDAGYLNPGDLKVLSGAAKDKTLVLTHIAGDRVALANDAAGVARQLAPGDELQIDNANFLALQTYHRHQVPTPDFKAWDQFRGPDGQPIYPQRPMLLGPMFVEATSGSVQTGKFQGKMIVVESLWDREAFPWQADWYRSRVQAHLGDKTDEHFRLWYTDRALHGDEARLEDPTRVVSYGGVLQQALRDVSAWVEKGIAPPTSTQYRLDEAQVIVPQTAAQRGGIQPVVTLLANRSVRAEVAVGEEVSFTGTIAVPPGTGSVVAAEWDFDGGSAFAVRSDVPKDAASLNVSIAHRFDKPGTYFPVLRGISQRNGDSDTPYARVPNLGRVRVVVKGAAPSAVANTQVSVDFAASRGPRLRAERMNVLSRARTFPEQRDADVQFYNEQGLHGEIYRVWVDAQLIHDRATGTYKYHGIEDYLADASRLSDHLLVVMDTRVLIRDEKQTPAQIKPVIKTIMRELKQRFPAIKYIEAFNEPDHNLAKVLEPAGLYDYYRVYYQAVNEINSELAPNLPLQVGGPAFMMYNEEWMRAFLDSYQADQARDKRLDFISYHAYGMFPPGTGGTQGPRAFHFYKENPSEVADQRSRLEAELRSRGLDVNTPSFITEIGIYPGPSFDNPKDPRPDYLIGAAGVPSLLYWFMEQPRTVPFNWVLRHFSEERKDQLLTRAGEGKAIPTGVFTPYGNALLMMSKLKAERVVARSNALVEGKGIYAIGTKDDTGAAVMLWNYQHIGTQAYRVTIDLNQLPTNLRKSGVRQRMFRIDDRTSNYWADPARANLQQISDETVKPGDGHSVTIELTPNALQLILLEPIAAKAR